MSAGKRGWTKEFQVGLFILAGMLVVMAFSFRITDTPIWRSGTRMVTYLDDATGVFRKSKIKMAGIDIGVIDKIELDNGKAKLTLLIDSGVDIPKGSQIVPRPLGILGDKYLEVVLPQPSSRQPDSESSDLLPADGAFLDNFFNFLLPEAKAQGVRSLQDGDRIEALQTPTTLDDVTRQLGTVSEDLRAISKTLRDLVERDGTVNSPVGRTLRNVESLSKEVDAIAKENRKGLRETIQSLSKLTNRLDEAFGNLDRAEVRSDIKSLTQAAANLSQSLSSARLILERIERGEGTLGKLVKDETTIVELNRSLTTLNASLDRARRTQLLVEVLPEYQLKSQDFKSYVSLRMRPRADVGYVAQVVVDPRGVTEETITTIEEAGVVRTVREVTQETSRLRYSFQYWKLLDPFVFRLGVFESTAGLSVAATMFDQKVTVGLEAFDFARDDDRPNLKLFTRYQVTSFLFVSAGVNEAISRGSTTVQRSTFIGVGLSILDDDLKTLALIPGVF